MGIGRSRKKRQRRMNGGKTVRLFGYDLFGRPHPLTTSSPGSEDESSALAPPEGPPRSRSTSGSLDADAAPLPEATIANLSRDALKWTPSLTDEQILREEQEQMEKEERRARRAARRLRKQQAATKASQDLEETPAFEGVEFEGFPGGNATLARDAFRPPSMQFEDDGEFGPYVDVPKGRPEEANREESEDEADAGGEYNRRSKKSANSGSGDGSSSRSRSYKSSSITDGSLYAPPHTTRHSRSHGLNLIQQQKAPHNIPLPPSSAGGSQSDLERPPLRLKTSKLRGRSAHSRSSASTSQPPSTPSPGPDPISSAHIHDGNNVSFQVGIDRFETLIHTSSLLNPTSSDFPSTGFGGVRGKRSGLRGGQGVALARTRD
ncbi:hypothetical protein BS47DRAFT_1342257 [Hydnum rufescens UP504]|uniref:Uncharacterized protein n=1 Tax=Hydnum rufescens UP504 TaxID=1448309 RepID=A0A9P6DXY4_9AGAM|nr:hypothetical protein BS47DRAFT_1342257 [Hydnum rufescens UP504]